MFGEGGKGRKNHALVRIRILRAGFLAVMCIVVLRLFFLQVLQGSFYKALAEGQHGFYSELFAKRGSIFVRDWADGSEYAIANMVPSGFVYADPSIISDPEGTARVLGYLLGYAIPTIETSSELTEQTVQESSSIESLMQKLIPIHVSTPPLEQTTVQAEDEYKEYHTLLTRLQKKNDPYEPVQHGVRADILQKIDEAKLDGIFYTMEFTRSYSETHMGGQLLGFYGMNDEGERIGLYGLEGYHEEFLKGENGFLSSVSDSSDGWNVIGGRAFERARNGGDLLLTIDRTIQYEACRRIKEGVEQTKSDSGSVIIMEPTTGRVIAMCGYPNFEPLHYADVDTASTFQNHTISTPYEPGSVIKPLVMASALDMGILTPHTTYTDSGEVKIGNYTIKNSDLQANGLQTMTQVLEKSLNTGMIFIMRKMGFDSFQEYMKKYGFGERTGIELSGESSGTIDALQEKKDIYYATASFGQGITMTPLQLAVAYSAIANGGYLMKPYIVEEKRYHTGIVEKIHPTIVRQVLSKNASEQAGAMMVSVVENGHARTAKLPKYYIAGKTGTAQVPRKDGAGYESDYTKATFAGFAPLDHPQFTMIVMLDHPRTSQWADATASPIWKQLADFMLQYFEITPQRTL